LQAPGHAHPSYLDEGELAAPKAPSEIYGNAADLFALENTGCQRLSANETVPLFMDGA
jgi:hypothetical protein